MTTDVTRRLKNATLPKDAVGRELLTKVPTAFSNRTVGELLGNLPYLALNTDSIDYIYILNKEEKLTGVISIRELLRSKPDDNIRDVMVKNLVVSHAQVHRKRVAHLAIKHNIKAVPVVDDDNRLLGILSSDKVLSILYDDYRREIYRSASIFNLKENFQTILDQGIWRTFLSRIPWILVGLMGGIFAAQIIEAFEVTLAGNIVLAAFIPLIVYVSAAVGTQTQTYLVRDLAFNPKITIIPYALKMLVTSSLIGLICGTLIWGLISLFWSDPQIGSVVGLAAFAAISASTVIAVAVPYTLFMIKQDPASGSGPFATILQDLLSIFIYFAVASVLLT